jgi:hypothetical protein
MSDKIGSSVFFWSFPSQALNEKTVALEFLASQVQEREAEMQQYDERIAELSNDRCMPGRDKLVW